MSKNEMRYIYYRKNKKSACKDGVVCVGYKFNEDKKELIFSCSFCSPKDSFCRKTARDEIKKNFVDDKFGSILGVQSKSYKEAVEAVAKELNKYKDVDIKSYSINSNFKEHFTVFGVNLPWWFNGVTLSKS